LQVCTTLITEPALLQLQKKAGGRYAAVVAAVCMLMFLAVGVTAQNRSNRGTEFWLGYGHNVLFTQGNPANSQTHVLYLSTETAATVTVSVNGTSWSRTVTIPANSVDFSIVLPKTGAEDARLRNEGLSTRGIHIKSTVPVVAYAHQYGSVSSAATMLMPVETFGYSYYSLNYTQVSNFPDSYSWFYAVAAEDHTKLEITPADSTEGGWLPGVTYTVTLQRGEIYNVFGKRTGGLTGKDLTGSKIVSVSGTDAQCHPVAVFSGSSRNTICNGNGGEVIQQQIFPANTWGTRYLTYYGKVSLGDPLTAPFLNLYRVAVRKPGTVVKRNGVPLTGLINNFYYEFSSTGGDYIESDEPVLVSQYMVSSNQCTGTTDPPMGDPEMIYLSPVEQGVKKAVFYHTRNQAIDLNHVNIITKAGGVSSLRIDGVAPSGAEVIPHPANPAYVVVIKRLAGAAAQHTITCDSTFIATVFGAGFYESYAYNTGTFVNNLNAYGSIQNTRNTAGTVDSFTCVNAPFTLTARLAYRVNSLTWELGKVPELNGAGTLTISNPQPVDSILLNSRKYFLYSCPVVLRLNRAGSIDIPITYSAPDIDACSNSEQAFLTVQVQPQPVIDFTVTGRLCANDTLQFSNRNPAGFTATEINWTFPGGITFSGAQQQYRFPAAGLFPVRLQTVSSNGCIGDTTKTVELQHRPLALFRVDTAACAGTTVVIRDSSAVTDGTIQQWYWDLGNGTTTNQKPTNGYPFTYMDDGLYTIRLATTSDRLCVSDTATQQIRIHKKPVAQFSISGPVCVGDSLLVTDASAPGSAPLVKWRWNWGNGNKSVTTSPMPFYYTYPKGGQYQVELLAEDTNGCVAVQDAKQAVIYTLPLVNAGTDQLIVAGTRVVLNASVNNAAAHTFRWTPAASLNNSTLLNPLATPGTSTWYTLTATHQAQGCSASDSVYVEVISGLYIPNAFSPNGDGINDVWRIPGLQAYPEAEVMLFNRWGQELLRRRQYNTNPWNGTYKGASVPAGMYMYLIRLNNGTGEVRKGTISVLR
jgi:gliding motility-associated-like protein